MNTAADVLANFRSQEDNEILYVLQSDEAMVLGLLAWKHLPVKFDFDAPVADRSWSGLWDCCSFDSEDWQRLLDRTGGESVDLWRRLSMFRLIYPDGSIHGGASKWLRLNITAKLKEGNS